MYQVPVPGAQSPESRMIDVRLRMTLSEFANQIPAIPPTRRGTYNDAQQETLRRDTPFPLSTVVRRDHGKQQPHQEWGNDKHSI
jgi:hypothetical protein